MSTIVNYSPTTAIGQAMFNFDAFGMTNYKLSGTVRVSVSDGFTFDNWYYSGGAFDQKFILGFTAADSEVPWTTEIVSNIQDILGVYSNFANVSFSAVTDYDTVGSWSNANPLDVGAANVSDINITFCHASDTSWLGQSGSRSDFIFGYTGAAGDIFLNENTPFFGGDFTFGANTKITQVLMHEIGHSLGLSHPFSSIDSYGVPVITADFAATQYLGFGQLGFRTSSAADMNKEYFTIMSYDDQNPSPYMNAYTPMILDLIALQQAYGEGSGTHGSGNDTIFAGIIGYRSYFDTGGIDTVDASMYADGAYLQMGVTITGASHLVGVLMSTYDALNTIANASDPQSLRWFYGEYEKASGSTAGDFIVGNVLNNQILGLGGSDYIQGAAGNDTLNGGVDADTMKGGAGNDTYVIDNSGDIVTEVAAQGTDLVQSSITYTLTPNVEKLTLTGTAAINGTGNGMNNTFLGNAYANKLAGLAGADNLKGAGGNDILNGGAGKDVLTGGAGNDFFVFNTILNASTNIDTLKDYSVVADTIRLENSIFTSLTTTGVLSASNLMVGTAAMDANDYIVYNNSTGALYYDADANGGEAAVQFATVYSAGTTLASLSAAEFVVI